MVRLTLSQGAHNLKSLDGRIRCFHRFGPTHWPDQLLQLAMIVEAFHTIRFANG